MKVHDSRSIIGTALDAYMKQVQKLHPAGNSRTEGASHNQVEHGGEDTLTLSDRVREVEKYRKLLESMNESRMRMVERLAREVREGTYHIDSRKIAEKILARLRDGD